MDNKDEDPFIYNTIEVPTVVGFLKDILTQYPDNGQIVKELVQNGEDAGATEVALTFDKRSFEAFPARGVVDIQRFLQGPSLCLFNDAEFTELDWQGVRRLKDSIKKNDPLKVGQFGLGFKSVFHITDYVTIVSGKYILFMDPSEPEATMCRTLPLRQLTTIVPVDVCLKLWGEYLTAQNLSEGYFPATLFWFPLRQNPSEISATVYSSDRVALLFQSFRVEAPGCLTFLKSLERLCLKRKSEGGSNEILLEVALESPSMEDVRKVRRNFKRELEQYSKVTPQRLTCIYDVTVSTTTASEGRRRQKLSICHYVPGGDEDVPLWRGQAGGGHLPHVGVAAVTEENEGPVASCQSQASIFCFLPLPPDPNNNTGLPVQVHGFFCLSQNRRHIKWMTGEGGEEPEVLWNEELVQHAVKEAYLLLLLRALKKVKSGELGVERWYELLPITTTTRGRWKDLATYIWTQLKTLPILYSKAVRRMVKPKDAITTFSLKNEREDLSKDVRKALSQSEVPLVEVKKKILDCLSAVDVHPASVSPKLLRDELKRSPHQMDKWKRDFRVNILEYMLREWDFKDAAAFPLLPLKDGSWTTFSEAAPPVYICMKDEAGALRGLEDQIVSLDLPIALMDCLQNVDMQRRTRLTAFSPERHAAPMLQKATEFVKKQRLETAEVNQWLKLVWSLLQKVRLETVRDLELVPINTNPNWESLVPLASAIIREEKHCRLSPELREALACLSVTVISCIPSFVTHWQIGDYFKSSDVQGITWVLNQIATKYRHGQRNLQSAFNNIISDAHIKGLCQLIDPNRLESDLKTLLRGLNLFKAKGSHGQDIYTCIDKCRKIAPSVGDFPVNFPEELIVAENEVTSQLAVALGAVCLTINELFLLSFKSYMKDRDKLNKLTEFVLNKKELLRCSEVRDALRLSPIVLTECNRYLTPEQMYDPNDPYREALLGEDLYPANTFSKHFPILRELGMKVVHEMPQKQLISAVKRFASLPLNSDELHRKATALFLVINSRPDCSQICQAVKSIPCVYGASTRPSRYPNSLHWATPADLLTPQDVKSDVFKNICGSVMPLISCGNMTRVSEAFGWNRGPDLQQVISHLRNIIETYNSSEFEYLELVKCTYRHLASHPTATALDCLKIQPSVFTERGFKNPNEVYIFPNEEDLKLEPYMHPLLLDLREHKNFFMQLGCFQNQSTALYLSLLRTIKNRHSTDKDLNPEHDRKIVISMLRKLQGDVGNIDPSQLLLPVETEDGSLNLVEITECSYSSEPCDWLDSEELGVSVVHQSIDSNLAEALGIKSLQKHMLDGKEEFMEWGQYEPLTTRLKNLLRQYRDGVAIFKEMIQNADDAGAQTVSFLYDERLNEDAHTRLIGPKLKDFQGPALWVYNNAVFTEMDFENLRKLGGGTKEHQSTKIGKFGLGFSSVYNLTDVPSFVSGSSFVILDPHLSHVDGAPGSRFNFSKKSNSVMQKKLNGQFKPFHSVFGCDIQGTGTFDGTLFRLPLRTPNQAILSDICKVSYQKSEMEELLEKFSQIIGEILLYTQNVQEVNVYHLSPNASSPNEKKLLMRSTRQVQKTLRINKGKLVKTPLTENIVRSVGELFDTRHSWSGEILQQSTVSNITIEHTADGAKFLHIEQRKLSVVWLTSWHTGVGHCCRLAQELTGKPLPLGAVSVPVKIEGKLWSPVDLSALPRGFYGKSHMHCFLPLPVQTSLPVQVNGFFSVAPDRTSLTTSTEDDRIDSVKEWNATLVSDAVTAAYHSLLETLRLQGFSQDFKYHCLWPVFEEMHGSLESRLAHSFYNYIVENDCIVFRDLITWLPLSRSVFLEESFHKKSSAGECAFKFMRSLLTKSLNKVMELPNSISHGFKESNLNIITPEIFFANWFLPHMREAHGSEGEITQLTLCLLDRHPDIAQQCRSNLYIPTKPYGKLRIADELIDPSSSVASMYNESDERFPQDVFLSSAHRKEVLTKIGMKTTDITKEMLCERANSVQNIPCPHCAFKRSSGILNFLAKKGKKWVKEACYLIKNVHFLPVMGKPADWIVSWKGDSCTVKKSEACQQHQKTHNITTMFFSTPQSMCLPCMKVFAGSTHLILDEEVCSDSHQKVIHYEDLGIITNAQKIPLHTVITQLEVFREESGVYWSSVKGHCHEIYRYLENRIIDEHLDMTNLSNQRILLTNFGFIEPKRFTLSLDGNCAPDVFSVKAENLGMYKHLMESLGIHEHVGPQTVLNILIAKQEKHGKSKLADGDVEQISKLLNLLFKEMADKNIQAADQLDLSLICLPDTKGILVPVGELCIDDDTNLSSGKFKYLNEKIKLSQMDIKHLGLKTKSRKRLEESCHRLNFGQSERLTTRLRNILKEYPCDSGIMKEMLQNADDAGATEISFIKDFRQHPTDKIFDEKLAPLQGPALCIYNNKCFSEIDIKGIQNLGDSNKLKDPASTGQYGIGFNAVYHITDAPSFLTRAAHPMYRNYKMDMDERETLCLFDPHCWYDPGATPEFPGAKYVNLADLRKDYPDTFSGYLDELVLQEEGTVFRLPLRTREDSLISQTIMTKEELETKIEEFKKEMKTCLPFLRSVRRISIKSIDNSGKCINEYTVEALVDDAGQCEIEKMKTEVTRRRQSASEKEKLEDYLHGMVRVSYNMTIKDSEEVCNQWHITQQLGAEKRQSIPSDIEEGFSMNSLNLLPHVGIAVLMQTKSQVPKDLMTTSCYLPLPVQSGLPFCVNGHFALNASRRDLWTGSDYRGIWNAWLMKEVMAPAAVQAVDYVRRYIFSGSKEHISHMMYKKKQRKYYSTLPDAKDCQRQWKYFPQWFYEYVKGNQVQLFDKFTPFEDVDIEEFKSSQSVVTRAMEYFSSYQRKPEQQHLALEKLEGSLTWHSMTDSKEMFPVYFNDHRDKHFLNALKRLGMKIGTSTMGKKLQRANIEYCKLTPDNVLDFFLSWTSNYPDKCSLTVEEHLSRTPILSQNNACKILEYLLGSEHFPNQIENFPLLVTEDCYLQVFSESNSKFISAYSDLLPQSKTDFLNIEMAKVFWSVNKIPYEQRVLKEFTLQDFAQRLEKNYPSLKNQKIPFNEAMPITKMRVMRFWEFVYDDIQQRLLPDRQSIDWKWGKSHLLSALGEWALYPMVENGQSYLIPIKKAFIILDVNLEQFGIGKLPIPRPHPGFQIPAELELTATLNNPGAMLEALVYHACSLANLPSRNSPECRKFLEYFGEQIMSHALSREKLRALPLYEHISGEHASITGRYFIVPKTQNIPNKNYRHCTERGQIFVLMMTTSPTLQKLYEYLEPSCLKEDLEIYAQYILPNFEEMEATERTNHLEFLRDQLSKFQYRNLSTLKDDEQRLISQLKVTPFIQVKGSLETASYFYDPFNAVFKAMGLNNLPTEWHKHEWQWFLKLAGMKHNITSNMFVDYINSLKASDESVTLKSQTLVEHLFSNMDDLKDVLNVIRGIEFIVPFRNESLGKILPHYETSSGLVSFSKSYPCSFENVIWSTASMLPYYAVPYDSSICKQLAISSTPPKEMVLKHIMSVCSELSEDPIKARDQSNQVMKSIYDHLSTGDQSFLNEIEACDIPIIHIPEKSACVSPNLVVLSLEDEIIPYLYTAPTRYGPYFPLFKKMGVQEKASVVTYTRILTIMNTLNEGQKLNPEEVRCMNMALEGIMKYKWNLKELKDTKLVLPTRAGKLELSTKMYVVDNSDLERAVSGTLEESLFIGFAALKIYGITDSEFVELLPKELRPTYLSDVVEQKFIEGANSLLPNPLLKSVGEGLESVEFKTAMLRLYNHHKKTRLTENEKENILRKLECISLKAVSEITKMYIFQGKQIGPTVISKQGYHVQKNTKDKMQSVTIFYCHPIEEKCVTPSLYIAFKKLFGNIPDEIYITMMEVFMYIREIARIHSFLDEKGIKAFDGQFDNNGISVYSSDIGSYLDVDFIHLLDNELCVFNDGELVCMKKYIHGEQQPDDEEIFIIVKVVQCVSNFENPIHDEYEVFTGAEDETGTIVKAHQLYKFVRKGNVNIDVDEDIVIRYITLQVMDMWKVENKEERKHLLRRLILKWDSDTSELAGRVKQHIQFIMGRLENGEALTEDDYHRTPPDICPSSTYDSIFHSLPSYYSKPVQFDGNDHVNYGRPVASGRHDQVRMKMSDKPEARRWMKQAEHDLSEAEERRNRSACWISYMCHQASEKSLKAALYLEDRDAAQNYQSGFECHSLQAVARHLSCQEAQSLAFEMECRVGHHTNMRYPNNQEAPCDRYTADDADFMLQKASLLLAALRPRF